MPALDVPLSQATVAVSIIDTTSWVHGLPCEDKFSPHFPGLTHFDICSFAFLISLFDDNSKKRHVIFDLGIRKDWKNCVPKMLGFFERWGAKIDVERDVADILRVNGVDLNEIDAVIWR